MSVQTAFKYILLGCLIIFVAGIIYIIQAGIAIVSVRTPDARIWLPVPIALGSITGKIIELPMVQDKEIQEIWKYREEVAELLRQLPGLPDADFVEVHSEKEQIRIFKRGDSFGILITTPDEKVNVRLPLATIESLVETFDNPNPTAGDFFACLKGQSPGDLVYVKTNTEEVRISIW
jgi:hypothetical protein